MKIAFPVINQEQLRWVILLLCTILMTWLIGPQIAVAGKTPFASIPHRIIVSFLEILIFLYFQIRKTEDNITNDVHDKPDWHWEELKNELEVLHKSLIDAIRFLHKNFINAFFLRYRTPWYLVIGPQSAGKTTLLLKSELNLTAADDTTPSTIAQTKYCDWWFAKEGVFIDVAGEYFQSSVEEDKTNFVLRGFFKLLKKHRPLCPINGLIVAINLQDLYSNPKQQIQLKKIRQVIQELVTHFKNFPIYLIVTRCDIVEGFVDFFDDLCPEDRNQPFGIMFPTNAHPQSLPHLFNEEFNQFLNRLNERIIWRIHQERNFEKRAKIKDFPLQMEVLKAPLAKLLNLILPNTQLKLRGIYFTSSTQKGTTIDNLLQPLSRAFNLQNLQRGFKSFQQKTFFIQELFKKIIFPDSKNIRASFREYKYYYLALLIISLLLGISCRFWYSNYQQNKAVLQLTNKILSQIDPVKNPTSETILNNLNTLQSADKTLRKIKSSYFPSPGLQKSEHLKNEISLQYQKMLTTQFLPQLLHTIEGQLKENNEITSKLYDALKTYLMFGNSNRFDKRYINNWFHDYWQQTTTDSAEQNELAFHLHNLLKQPLPALALNTSLITETRQLLNNMPTSKLVLTLLKDQYNQPNVKLFDSEDERINNNFQREIPAIYSISFFRDVYENKIIPTCREISNGNWVLGNKQQPTLSENAFIQLVTEVKSLYLIEYANTWNNVLSKVKMESFQDLNQILNIVNILNGSQSPLVQLLTAIKTNTQPINDIPEFNQIISTKFQSLNTISLDNLKNISQTSLVTLRSYLENIAQSADVEKSSFEAAKLRMENKGISDALGSFLQQARQQPEPVQTWFTTIATESWRLILKNTESYLNRIWVSTALPHYERSLNRRYPLFQDSTTDITMADFANFFGPTGTVDTFFKNYLQPFVDNSHFYWELRNVDGQRLNIPQPTLEMFIRAALIQKMFFPDESKIPNVNFSLVPVMLASNIQSFNLDIDSQPMVYQRENKQITAFNWPGTQPGHAEITMTDDRDKKTTFAAEGTWGLFKLLDKAHLESTQSPKHFLLTFDINGYATKFELFASGLVNPFIPGILHAFRCPDSL